MGVKRQLKTLLAPLDHINLHIRGGYILPWQEPANNTHYSRQNFVGLTAALDDEGKAEGWLFWDDGQSINTYEEGKYYLANFSVGQNKLENHIIHNDYIVATKPLWLGYINIWGAGADSITQVNVTYNSQNLTLDSFHHDQATQVLSMNLTTYTISLGKPFVVTWRNPL